MNTAHLMIMHQSLVGEKSYSSVRVKFKKNNVRKHYKCKNELMVKIEYHLKLHNSNIIMQQNNLFALENNIPSVIYSGVTKGRKPHDDKNNHNNMK